MKRLTVLLLCLLLAGCSQKKAPAETEAPPETTVITAPTDAPRGLYDPESTLEDTTQGALRVYPLRFSTITDMRAFGEDLLIFSAGEEATAITCLSGDALHVTASTVVGCPLDTDDPSLQIWGDTLAYYDPNRRETVVLDRQLKEVGRMALPEDLQGRPLLCADRNTVYYCTADTLRACDLETDLHRVVKQMDYEGQTVSGLHVNDTILQCSVVEDGREKTLLLSAQDGRLLYEGSGSMTLSTVADRFFAALPAGGLETLVFGRGETEAHILSPRDLDACAYYLPEKNGAVTAAPQENDTLRLDYYDLETGSRVSTLTLSGGALPMAVEATASGQLYLLRLDGSYDCEVIYRWDVTGAAVAAGDESSYAGPFYTSAVPDRAGLAACQARAAEIGERYGLEILLWQDVLEYQGEDCRFGKEYLVPVLERELTLLDGRLARFPAEVLSQSHSHFTSLKLCLVRSLEAVSDGAFENVNGLQFFRDTDAYVAVAVGREAEEALYRGLYQVMDTHVMSKSMVLYRWEELNPQDFAYDMGNKTQRSGAYLEEKGRAFVDEESMAYAREDRSRVFARAMLPGQEELFRSPILQAKLTMLCEAIRNSYGLRKSPQVFPWEQYLQIPWAQQD